MIRKDSLFAWAPVASVVLIIVAVYCAWTVAYAQLGRPPLPSMDDPKGIGGFSTGVYWFCVWTTLLLVALWAITSVYALVMGVLPKTQQRSRWWLGFVAGLMAFGLLLPLAQSSPGDAIGWFGD